MGNLSVIIATYTGQDHIADCLEAIVTQNNTSILREVIIVIDGPNEVIVNIASEYSEAFRDKGIEYRVEQLERNVGRFDARLKGANLARGERLLFIDDRTMMQEGYLTEVASVPSDVRAFISSIKESSQPNMVSKALYYVRKAIYKNWGDDFKPHYVTLDNFESEAKGAAGMMVARDVFLAACDEFKSQTADTGNSSDDTKLLRIIVSSVPIFKSPKLVLYYEPRTSLIDELVHIYQRGPKFVDYYLRPSSRYFVPLLLFFVATLSFVIMLFVNWLYAVLALVAGLVVVLLLALLITKSIQRFVVVAVGVVFMVAYFGAGLWLGLVRKIFGGLGRE